MKTVINAKVKNFLSGRVQALEEKIGNACARSGRKRGDIRLVAVTKTVSPSVAAGLFELGVTDLAESRPQELWRKAPEVPGACWHLVGRLQRNKVERTLPLVSLIHSVDSIRLLQTV